jgi:hypothetical protein
MAGAVNEALPKSNARLYDPIADRATVAALFRSLKRAGWEVFHEEI